MGVEDGFGVPTTKYTKNPRRYTTTKRDSKLMGSGSTTLDRYSCQ
jgi:hypothetical protein